MGGILTIVILMGWADARIGIIPAETVIARRALPIKMTMSASGWIFTIMNVVAVCAVFQFLIMTQDAI